MRSREKAYELDVSLDIAGKMTSIKEERSSPDPMDGGHPLGVKEVTLPTVRPFETETDACGLNDIDSATDGPKTVSYTHLTLPTKRIV